MTGMPQSRCYLPPTMMDPHSTPEVELHIATSQKIYVIPDITTITDTPNAMPKLLTEDRLHAILEMQKTDPFSKHISKHLPNGKAPKHEADLFLHIKGLLYKHVTDSNQMILALVIPKTWKYTVLMEAHDKHDHQGATCTYCLIKHQYY